MFHNNTLALDRNREFGPSDGLVYENVQELVAVQRDRKTDQKKNTRNLRNNKPACDYVGQHPIVPALASTTTES